MSLSLYGAFVLACLVIILVPGPTVTLIVANSIRYGTRAGLANVAGTQVGLGAAIAVVGVGLTSLIEGMGHWFEWVRLLGAAYLIWMGIQMLRSKGALNPDGTARRPRGGFFLQGLTNSLSIAAMASLFAILVGVPFAFCVARLPIAGKPVLLALAALPLVLPSFVSAYALVLMFGRAGIVTTFLRDIGIPFDSIYGVKGIVITYTLTLYPYVVLPTVAAFKALDISMEEAAQNIAVAPMMAI